MSEQALLANIGTLLARMGAEIERLGGALCTDPAVCSAHMDALQDIDRIAQMQRSLAAILVQPDLVAAAQRTELECVRAALS